MINEEPNSPMEVISIIPAAGVARRLPDITGSKEMIPVGTISDPVSGEVTPKPVCLYLLEKYKSAGIKKCFIIIREGKWDIPGYLASGEDINMSLVYIVMKKSHGTAFTIDQAYPYVNHAYVALGFPDILFSQNDSYSHLLRVIKTKKADVVLGIFPAERPEKVDMVEIDNNNIVKDIIIKPRETSLTLTWGIAVWNPVFTQFLHDYSSSLKINETDPELHIGIVIQTAINSGLTVVAETVSDEAYLDIGTPDDLSRALNIFMSE